MLEVTFYGVRGSTPCASTAHQRYGGNTACVALEVRGEEPIVLDLGTGLRYWGDALDERAKVPFAGHALVTHLHWDHVQGLPFFMPINRRGSRLSIYGPPHDGLSIGDAFAKFMRPPYFPIHCKDLTGEVRFRDVLDESFAIGSATVTARTVPHVGTTNGYRVDWAGASVAYISDHQQPADDGVVAPEVLELCRGVDLLIHECYFPDGYEELAVRTGHSCLSPVIAGAAMSLSSLTVVANALRLNARQSP